MGALVWFIAAVVLAALELAAGEFTFLMIAAGALTAAGASLAGIPLWAEVAVFVASSAAFWFFLRPLLHRQFLKPGVYDETPRALVGTGAEVVADITPSGGQVRLDGTIWSARSLDPAVSIPAGQHVTVSDIDGPVAVVWKEP